MGSDYLFILRNLRTPTSETELSDARSPNHGARGSRNGGATIYEQGSSRMAAPCFSAAAAEIHSGGFLVSCVFGIFMLPLPFCKLSLTFLAFVVGDDVRQKTAGDSLNGVLRN